MALTEKQVQAAEALATRLPYESLGEVCKRAGVSLPTLWRYRQKEEFRQAVDERIQDVTWAERGPILHALTNKAKEGDVQAVRLLMQWRGELVEKSQVEQTVREVKVSERAARQTAK